MRASVRAIFALLLFTLPTTVSAQRRFPPDSLVNVKVIAKDTPVREVVAMMRGWTGALGVRCTHCHVGEDDRPLNTLDFASDEKRPKEVARVMMQMVNAINGDHLSKLPAGGPSALRVTCETCHRGIARPERIERVIESIVTTAGVDSAVRAYRGLLSAYEHRGSYNFTEAPLSGLAQQLAARQQYDDALALLTLNEDTHKGSPDVPLVRGDVLLAKGDTAAAVAAYQLALQRAPNGPARFRLRDLGRQ
jgi:tetratricopeptide (TPR) repeat protein